VGLGTSQFKKRGRRRPQRSQRGALTPAAKKGRPVGGWLATAPTTVPAGAPTTAAVTLAAGPAGALMSSCGGASGYDRTHGMLTGGSGGLKGVEAERWRSSHG
jgi:hypothetical protein